MKRLVSSLVTIGSAFIIAACGSEHGNPLTAPSAASSISTADLTSSSTQSAPSLLGTWVSVPRLMTASTISLAVCTNIQLQITNQTSTQATGTLSMDCPDSIRVDGTIVGQLGGATIPLTWNGTATQAGFPSCAFSLTGVGTPLSVDTFRITYSGSSCTGPIQGADTLRLASANSSSPTAPSPSAPAPSAPATSGWQTCGSTPGDALVACIISFVHPAHTPEGAFEVTKRVAWQLREFNVGLLIKNGGENIVSWKGYSFSASRICLPDGHLYKVLSDVPATNGASWQDNDYVSPSLYVPAIFPE